MTSQSEEKAPLLESSDSMDVTQPPQGRGLHKRHTNGTNGGGLSSHDHGFASPPPNELLSDSTTSFQPFKKSASSLAPPSARTSFPTSSPLASVPRTSSSCFAVTVQRLRVVWAHVVSTVSNSRRILSLLWRNTSGPAKAPIRKYFLKLFVFRVFLLLLTTFAHVAISYPVNWFNTALNQKDSDGFYWYLEIFVLIALIAAPVVALESYISDLLAMRFRQHLTNSLFDLYMGGRAFYHLRARREIDNPGQRLGDDIRTFGYGIFGMFERVLKQVLNLIGFSYVLFQIKSSVVPVLVLYSCMGTLIVFFVFSRRLAQISEILMKDQCEFRANIVRIHDNAESIALYDAARHERNWLQLRLDTLISDGIWGARWQACLELFANIFSQIAIVLPYVVLAREYFEGNIELGDMSQSAHAFSVLLKALNVLITNITTLTSLSATTERVVEAMDAIYSIHDTDPWAKSSHDLNALKKAQHAKLININGFKKNLKESRAKNGIEGMAGMTGQDEVMRSRIETVETDARHARLVHTETIGAREVSLEHAKRGKEGLLVLTNVSYFAPRSEHLLADCLSCCIRRHESLLIMGASGAGKSSLLRVVAGLWSDGYGMVHRPKLDQCMFLPQKPYVPNLPLEHNSLRNQLLFPTYFNDNEMMFDRDGKMNKFLYNPQTPLNGSKKAVNASSVSDAEVADILQKVHLDHLSSYASDVVDAVDAVDATDKAQRKHVMRLIHAKADWANSLSMGELQRLAVGRVLLAKPEIVFLDEATSALDKLNEDRMYQVMKEMNVAMISVGHHERLANFHDFILKFKGDAEWELLASKPVF